MKQTDPMAEDMFEKAREAFFGTANVKPKVNSSSVQPVVPTPTTKPCKEYGIVGMVPSDTET
jgi:hypothetical protein